eukprot:9468493-Pyramimonas_sp.AAC.1
MAGSMTSPRRDSRSSLGQDPHEHPKVPPRDQEAVLPVEDGCTRYSRTAPRLKRDATYRLRVH